MNKIQNSLLDYCREQDRQELLTQWDTERNGTLTPGDVSYGSHRRIWWKCEKGHSWQAQVRARVVGSGCPVCSKRQVVPGINDLATLYPELVEQWDRTKNGALSPDRVAPGRRQKVWWQCEKGHSWQAVISSRSGGRGCPVCAGKQVVPGDNDLASSFPEIAAQWHLEKNGNLTPGNVTPSSNRRVWWLCDKGHAYETVIAHRTRSLTGCPYCTSKKVLPGFNDLATRCPKVAAQWHEELNGTLTPSMVTAGSSRRVWWKCPDGHVWKAVIHSRAASQRCGCPVCAGKFPQK